MRCLWLSRSLPFPQDSGDRIYSAQLARALALAGAQVEFVGHRAAAPAPDDWPLRWHAVDGGCRPTWRALASLEPLNGAIHDTPAYRQRIDELLPQRWDAVVLDTYGMGWALDRVRRHIALHPSVPPVLVHVSHNHEATLWRGMLRGFDGSALRRLGVWQNVRKVERTERRLVRAAELLSCITAEDARAYGADDAPPTLVLTPGYGGAEAPARPIAANTGANTAANTAATTAARRVVLMGSFRWVAKQQNLLALAQHADAAFRAHGITLDVIGDVPAELRDALAPFESIVLHGFVDDVAPLMREARLALVPEVIGGGFKLKFLDYVFGRLPVVTLAAAAAGLPAPVRAAMICCADLDGLVASVVEHIDDLPRLESMQQEALNAARAAFDWRDRGVALREGIRSAARARPQGLRIDAAGVQV